MTAKKFQYVLAVLILINITMGIVLLLIKNLTQ